MFGLADKELRLVGADDTAFAALRFKYSDVLGGTTPGRRTAAWSSSSSRATPRCRGRGR